MDGQKTIIVTGASRGIGMSICQLAQQKKHRIIGLSRNIEPLEQEGIQGFSVDVSDPNGLDSFLEFVAANNLSIDALINNAGQLQNIPFSNSNWAVFEAVYRVNVFGLAETIRRTLPFMNASSHVVNISSMGGIQGSSKFPGLAAYSSSKGAVITLTELLAEEYKDSGPSFNALALGAVQTEMLAEAFPGYNAPTTAAEMGNYILHFALEGHALFNGKVLSVANSTP